MLRKNTANTTKYNNNNVVVIVVTITTIIQQIWEVFPLACCEEKILLLSVLFT